MVVIYTYLSVGYNDVGIKQSLLYNISRQFLRRCWGSSTCVVQSTDSDEASQLLLLSLFCVSLTKAAEVVGEGPLAPYSVVQHPFDAGQP